MSKRPPIAYLAEVEWVDSTGAGDWHDPEQALHNLELMGCTSAGLVLADEERGIVLALAVGSAGQVLSSMAIPRGAIVAVHRLVREVQR